MDIDTLVRACDNDNNKHILNLTNDTIMKAKVEIVNELPVSVDIKYELLDKLKGYMFIDEIHEIRSGTFLRWIDATQEEITLAKGAILCEIKFTDYGTTLRMKNFRHKYFELKMDDIVLFQKLTPQERVLLSALSYVNKD